LRDSKILEGCEFKLDDDPVSYLPAIKAGVKFQDEAEIAMLSSEPSIIWRKQVPPSNWGYILNILFRENTIGHPAPKSSSPDLLFKTKYGIVGFEVKLNASNNSITWADLQEEINKAYNIVMYAKQKVCLVFVVLHLGREILNSLHGLDSMLLTSNYW
jgi:hypothetical protein